MSTSWHTIGWVACCVVVIGVMAVIDHLSGPDFAFVLSYLLPVVVTGWKQGSGAAVVIALVASLSWAMVAWLGGDFQTATIATWNSLSRLVIFTGAAILTARLRRDQDRLAELARREAELARIDPVTRLPNWRGFEERLEQAIARCGRLGTGLTMGYADLDNFKRVNDLHGHPAGDELLRSFGQRLREALRAEDVVARVGGDEFMILAERSGPADAEVIGKRLLETVARLAERVPETELGASLGLVIVAQPEAWSGRAAELVQRADAAMYEAKRAGKNRVVVITLSNSV